MCGPRENRNCAQPTIYSCGGSKQNWPLHSNCVGQQRDNLRERLGNLDHTGLESACTGIAMQRHRDVTAANTNRNLGDDKHTGGAKNEDVAGKKRTDTGHLGGRKHATNRHNHAREPEAAGSACVPREEHADGHEATHQPSHGRAPNARREKRQNVDVQRVGTTSLDPSKDENHYCRANNHY